MEPSALLVPSTRTSFIPSAQRGVYANLLSSCSRRAAQKCFDVVPKHTRWFIRLNSYLTQPSKPLSCSSKLCTCTLEGDTIGDDDAEMAFTSENVKSVQTTTRESENGSVFQIVKDESENGKAPQTTEKQSEKSQSIVGATKKTYVPKRTGRYIDRVGKEILVPLDALKTGAILTGKVTNITTFGAFVDVGAFVSGLVHVSGLTTRHVSSVKDIEDIVKVGEIVKVMVMTVDPSRGRLRLKLIRECAEAKPPTILDITHTAKNTILMGMVVNITKVGVFVDVGAFTNGLIHISSLTTRYNSSVKDIEDIVKVGEVIKVKVITADPSSGRLRLELIRGGLGEKPLTLSDTSQTGDKTPIPISESTVNPPWRPPKGGLGTGSSAKIVSDSSQAGEKATIAISKRSPPSSPRRPQKGELITGSIAKIFSSGVYVTLNQGHEGFLPASEVLSSGVTVETTSYFRVGQQVPVRVLRTTRNRITLTMRKQKNPADIRVDSKENVLGSKEGRATSPFEIAFRRDKVIAKFLEERERLQNPLTGNEEEESVGESL